MSALHGIDLGARGVQSGSIDVTISNDQYDFGVIPTPLTMMSHGEGPTVLLVAGTHGDEYEGQVILRRLIHELPLDDVTGRLIILPALNLPAVQAGRRVSPVDSGNLNRAYPGASDGTPTEQIAYAVYNELLPEADLVLDLHSGGSQTFYLPSTFVYASSEPSAMAEKRRLAELMGLPWAIQVPERFEPRSLSTAADERGIPMISTEMGGGGMIDMSTADAAYSGLLRILSATSAISSSTSDLPAEATKWIAVEDDSAIRTPTRGLFRPTVGLGEVVRSGDVVGYVFTIEDPSAQPVPVRSHRDGVIAIIRRPPIVDYGALLLTIGTALNNGGGVS